MNRQEKVASRRPISVLFFTNTTVRAGVEEHIITLLRGLDRGSFRTYLAGPRELLEKLQPDVPADVECFPMSLGRVIDMSDAYRLGRILRSRRIDVLHSHMFRSSMLAAPVGWIFRVPAVVETSHGREGWRTGWFKSKFWVDRVVAHFVDAYIAVSQANARYLVERKRIPACKVTTIYNGCDVSMFNPERRASAALRARVGLQDRDRVLLMVGRLEPQKAHRVLIDALPQVVGCFPDARAIFVGSGGLQVELQQQVRSLNLDGRVFFAGFQSNMPEWYALADVVVLPSFYEGLPLAAIEALASGRPLVATAVDGTAEVVVDGESGLTVMPGDHAALAHALCRVLGDPDLARRLAIGGRRRVQEHFSAARQLEQTQNLYRRCLARAAIFGATA